MIRRWWTGCPHPCIGCGVIIAYSTESGHLFQLKAVTCSDALRPQMAERSEGVRSGTGEALS